MMAVDLNTARRAAQERGERPPGGEQPGTPAYDQWVMAWFENGLNAGDPDLVRRAGGGSGAGWGAGQAEEGEGGIAPWQDAADPSTWLGQRKPTPRELRKYARVTGQSEDYQRYDDRQLAAWINKSWDVGQGGFYNDFGDRVEKPTESGALSTGAGYATGERAAGQGRRGGGGGGGTTPGMQAPAFNLQDIWKFGALSSPLAQMLANQGGWLRQYDPQVGNNAPGVQGGVMKGGTIWYQPTRTGGGVPVPMTGSLVGTMAGVTAPQSRPTAGLPSRPTPTMPITNAPTSSLANAITPYQSGFSGQSPYSGNALAGPGTVGVKNPLTDMLSPYQIKRKRPGSWF